MTAPFLKPIPRLRCTRIACAGGLLLCLLGQDASAADVLVVTDSRHPVQSASGARVIELDLPERIEAELREHREHLEELVRSRVKLVGATHELEGDTPTIVFAPHFYSMDAGGLALPLNTEREFTSIFATNPDPDLDAWFMNGRQRFGNVKMLNRADGVKPIIQCLRKGGLPPDNKWLTLLLVLMPLGPLFGNSAGWIFTEMGRQPWIVAGVLPTASAVSPGVGAGTVFASMIGFTLLYGALAVVEVGLMVHYAKAGLPAEVPPVEIKGEDDVLSFAY